MKVSFFSYNQKIVKFAFRSINDKYNIINNKSTLMLNDKSGSDYIRKKREREKSLIKF